MDRAGAAGAVREGLFRAASSVELPEIRANLVNLNTVGHRACRPAVRSLPALIDPAGRAADARRGAAGDAPGLLRAATGSIRRSMRAKSCRSTPVSTGRPSSSSSMPRRSSSRAIGWRRCEGNILIEVGDGDDARRSAPSHPPPGAGPPACRRHGRAGPPPRPRCEQGRGVAPHPPPKRRVGCQPRMQAAHDHSTPSPSSVIQAGAAADLRRDGPRLLPRRLLAGDRRGATTAPTASIIGRRPAR